jgi:hypothetical protein
VRPSVVLVKSRHQHLGTRKPIFWVVLAPLLVQGYNGYTELKNLMVVLHAPTNNWLGVEIGVVCDGAQRLDAVSQGVLDAGCFPGVSHIPNVEFTFASHFRK